MRSLKTLMEYLLAEAREPSQRDILDAIEHAKEGYPEEIDQDAGIEDFDKVYLGKLTVDEIGRYDDLSSWMEDISDEDELRSFRGEKWKRMAELWGDAPPPIVIVSGDTFTVVGDGRGRVSYASYRGIPLEAWELRYKNKAAFDLSLDKLVAHRDALFDAYVHCAYRGKCSKSSGPIVVVETEDGKYQLTDGYHRLIEHLLDHGGASPLRAIIGGEGSGEYAIARGGERWAGDASKRYGNLEDLTDKRTLAGHAKRRKMQKSLKNVK